MKLSYSKRNAVVLTFGLSGFLLVYFFGTLLLNPNTYCFGGEGDGLQTYFATSYHAKHDSDFLYSSAMNYPYGENIFFIGCQPIISNTIILLKHVNIDLFDYIVGITNLFMLLSLVVSAIFILLIFFELGINNYFACIAAVLITFLSPQVNRMGGHYNLTYEFFIPASIYFFLKAYNSLSFRFNIYIALLALAAAFTHLYFFVFIAILGLFFNGSLFITKKIPLLKFLLNILVQIIIPYCVLAILMIVTHSVADRTSIPWGYLIYKSNLTGILYPFGKYYEPFIAPFIQREDVDMEGISYLGLVSIALLLVSLIAIPVILWKRKYFFLNKTDGRLNILLFCSLLLLVYSFGIPFKYDMEKYYYYLGPIKQFRGLGRFAWLFYYVSNIWAVYFVCRFLFPRLNNYFKTAIGTIIILIYAIDVYAYCGPREPWYQSKVDDINVKNQTEEMLQVQNSFNKENYQAIFSIPQFFIGSDNMDFFHAAVNSEIIKYSYVLSLNTGLPLFCNTSSRSSILQAAKHRQLYLEPYRQYSIMNELKNSKPFLVLSIDSLANFSEKQFLSKAKKIYSSNKYSLYELAVDSIKSVGENLFQKKKSELLLSAEANAVYSGQNSETENFISVSYDSLPSELPAYNGNGCYSGIAKDYNFIFDKKLNNTDTGYIYSFWFKNITQDLYPRTTIAESVYDSLDNVKFSRWVPVHDLLKTIDGDWGLVEAPVQIPPHGKLQIVLFNWLIIGEEKIFIDEFLVRRGPFDVIRPASDLLYFNNRFYRNGK